MVPSDDVEIARWGSEDVAWTRLFQWLPKAILALLQGAEGVTSATNTRGPEPTESEQTYPQNRNSNNVWNPLPRTRKSFPIHQPSVGECNVAICLSSVLLVSLKLGPTSSKLLCLVIDEGKTVTGIMFGVHFCSSVRCCRLACRPNPLSQSSLSRCQSVGCFQRSHCSSASGPETDRHFSNESKSLESQYEELLKSALRLRRSNAHSARTAPCGAVLALSGTDTLVSLIPRPVPGHQRLDDRRSPLGASQHKKKLLSSVQKNVNLAAN